MAEEYEMDTYGRLIEDKERTVPYKNALSQTIKPGMAVVDIGTGPGILALLACQCGARRVYAIEHSDTIHLAKEMAAANGYADRIEFIQAMSTEIALPEQVEVIVFEIHGILPLHRQAINSIVDARRRFLAPGGKLIPQQETLWAAITEAPKAYEEFITRPWRSNDYGLDLSPGLPIMTNTWKKIRVEPEQLLVSPQNWATLDYTKIESPNVRGEVTWSVEKPGTGHGLVLWFETMLAPGVGFSNAPGKPKVIFGQGFFPWPTPVNLAAGDEVSVILQANLLEEDYLWRWDTRISGQGPEKNLKADFKQSTFFGAIISPTKKRQVAKDFVPTLNEDGEIERFILNSMDGGTSLEEIAIKLLEIFPRQFSAVDKAFKRTADLSLQHGLNNADKYSRRHHENLLTAKK
jgi:protein arginine N-methyltransferase 1